MRGAFAVDDTVYAAWSNGTFTAQSFDGSNFGNPQAIDLYEGTPTTPGYANNFVNDLASITGIFYDPGRARIYYTMQGSSALFWRPFTPESRSSAQPGGRCRSRRRCRRARCGECS